MCKILEDMRLAEREKIARALIMMGELSYEKIAKSTELTVAEIEKVAQKEEIYS